MSNDCLDESKCQKVKPEPRDFKAVLGVSHMSANHATAGKRSSDACTFRRSFVLWQELAAGSRTAPEA